jgi:glucose-1-phosphate thymidylyltransferase
MGDVVGLIPAAGIARRLAPLPCSKEMFPVGFKSREHVGQIGVCPKPVSEYLIERMRDGGARRIYVVLSHAKWDVIQYYGNGDPAGIPLAYLYLADSAGMPYTLDAAYPWLGHDETVLFGMPDTIFWPYDAFAQLLSMHEQRQSDLTLGVFPTDQPERFSVVDLDDRGRVRAVQDKPAATNLHNTWGMACWGPAFTELLHAALREPAPFQQETVLADVFLRAIDERLAVYGHYFEHGEYIDIGVAEDLCQAVRRFSGSPAQTGE